MDQLLNCLRLRWHRTSGDPGHLQAGKEYGLAPLGSIRGTVMRVPRNTIMSVIDMEEPRAVKYFKNCDGVAGWENELFHVNRFYNRNLKEFMYDESFNSREEE